MKRLGEKLRTLRQRRGLTLRELGDRLDVDYGYVGRMERGEKIPNLEMLLKISDLFGVSLDQLARDELELD
jgi:transcriptional regulator with XRE-family HTH domain